MSIKFIIECMHLSHLSKQLPTAISMVSPNILYLCLEYAMICVLPPLTYNTVGLLAFVINLPISMSDCILRNLEIFTFFIHSKTAQPLGIVVANVWLPGFHSSKCF